ncbi:hypothetical protein Drorol1_Dr00020849 [Drosera rotundifolia]
MKKDSAVQILEVSELNCRAVSAASKTVGCLKFDHHVQAYFLRGGDYKVPTIFKVFQVHDGKDITTLRVEAIQEGKLAFLLVASFLKKADGLEHQEAVMPVVPSPDMLLSIEDVMEKSSLEYHLSRLSYWFKSREKLSDDPALHWMWFHRTARADEWILHVIDSPSAYDARGICTSQMFNTKELVALLVQEGLLRRDNTINTDTSIRAKF